MTASFAIVAIIGGSLFASAAAFAQMAQTSAAAYGTKDDWRSHFG